MRTIPKVLLLLIGSLSIVFTGCPGPLQPNGGIGKDEVNFTATTEGNIFATVDRTTDNGTVYQIHAVETGAIAGGDVVIDIVIPKRATVPYTVSVGSDADAVLNYCLELSSGVCTTYKAEKGSGSGTITVTQITPDLKGTFSGTLPLVGGGSGSRTLSGGEFWATF